MNTECAVALSSQKRLKILRTITNDSTKLLAWDADVTALCPMVASELASETIPLVILTRTCYTLKQRPTTAALGEGYPPRPTLSEKDKTRRKGGGEDETDSLSNSSSSEEEIDCLEEDCGSDDKATKQRDDGSFYFRSTSDHGSLAYSFSWRSELDPSDDSNDDCTENYLTQGFIDVGELPHVSSAASI